MKTQLEFEWDHDRRVSKPRSEATPLTAEQPVATDSPVLPPADRPPAFSPMLLAVEAGVFGMTESGPITPDAEEVASLTEEHAREMASLLIELTAVEDGLRSGRDPSTGRLPRTEEARLRLLKRLNAEHHRLQQSYADAVAVFAEAFGDQAAAALDAWVRKIAASVDPSPDGYPPTHPWHYLDAGDNAVPIPLDEIPVDEEAGNFLGRDLPKNASKRLAKLRESLIREREQLEADRQRYAEIVERGAEALSRYDREIAHTSDAMARATALALKYRHVSLGLGRVAWLERELCRPGVGHSQSRLPRNGV